MNEVALGEGGRLAVQARIRNGVSARPVVASLLLTDSGIPSFNPSPSPIRSLTVKTVYLLRHAKSSWDQPSLTDDQRPLAPRGIKAAPRVGAHMLREGFVPDRVLCSAARRAQETWELVSEALGSGSPVEVLSELYLASPSTLLTLIQGLADDEGSVLLVGHNPTFEDLALALAGTGEEGALDALESKYPTGALAVLEFRVRSWREVRPGIGFLRAFVRPKELK